MDPDLDLHLSLGLGKDPDLDLHLGLGLGMDPGLDLRLLLDNEFGALGELGESGVLRELGELEQLGCLGYVGAPRSTAEHLRLLLLDQLRYRWTSFYVHWTSLVQIIVHVRTA